MAKDKGQKDGIAASGMETGMDGLVPEAGKRRTKGKMGRNFWLLMFCLSMAIVSAVLLYRVVVFR